jgi:hypothetical protein
MRMAAIAVLLVGFVAVGVHVAREPATAWLANLGRSGDAVGSGGSVGIVIDDPVARFSETRVGHLLFKPFEGDHCRRVLFDNSTGGYLEAGQVFCGRALESEGTETGNGPGMPSAARIRTLSKAFRK